jgi:hypothetical protein
MFQALTFSITLSLLSGCSDKADKVDLVQGDLTDPKAVDAVFERYASQGGIWGLVHIAVRPFVIGLSSLRDASLR